MKLNLLACVCQRSDKRANDACVVEMASGVRQSLYDELTEILVLGDAVEIEVHDKNTATALRALKKLDVDYEILE